MTDEKKKLEPAVTPPPRVLTREEVRELLAEGRRIRRDVEARFDRMERLDPREAQARAR
ncbi:MAG: hypothetical protein KF901_02160 [Myxococcales bacterium]|nr:hypothetical protein [Myxococcales bacterium]